MATNNELMDLLEKSAKRSEDTSDAYYEVLTSEGEKDIQLSDGTTTPNLNKRIKELGGQVTSVAGKTGDVTITDISESLELGSASKYNVSDLPVKDSSITTWSGRKQDKKNKDTISPFDYQARGDGITDDTQAFIDLEDSHIGLIVDLQGKSYAVKSQPQKNKYVNGYFVVERVLYNSNYMKKDNFSPLINPHNYSVFCKKYELQRTSETGGYNSIPQGACFDHKNGKIFQVAGGGTDGRGHSLNIFDAPNLGVLKNYVRNRSVYFGHQGVGVSYDGDKTIAWMGRNYNNQAGTGNKVVSFDSLKNEDVNSITDGILEWSVFEETTSSQSTSPAVSSCGKYLIVRMYKDNKIFIRVFDLISAWENRFLTTDLSNKYLHEFSYDVPTPDSAMQGLACDGSFVYALDAEYGFGDNAWVYVFTIQGELLYRINIHEIGLQDAIKNSPNPTSKDGIKEYEGLLIFENGGKKSLGILMGCSWVENGDAAKKAFIYEVGSLSAVDTTKEGLSIFNDDENKLHSSSGNQKYNFGVNGSSKYFWTINPERNGIITNNGNPVCWSNGLTGGLQFCSSTANGQSNLLLGRSDTGSEGARIIFHKSRSGVVDYNSISSIGTASLGTILFNGDATTKHAQGVALVAKGTVVGENIDSYFDIIVNNDEGVGINYRFDKGAFYSIFSGSQSLGTASKLWSNIYSSNGTINTSDEKYKTDITALSDKERLVAKSIKPLIKKFKMKDAVAEKGKDARWHIGVVAQEVISAFNDQGLNPFDYGIVCFDEWEATDDYEAGSRYAIRYDELAMFILSSI